MHTKTCFFYQAETYKCVFVWTGPLQRSLETLKNQLSSIQWWLIIDGTFAFWKWPNIKEIFASVSVTQAHAPSLFSPLCCTAVQLRHNRKSCFQILLVFLLSLCLTHTHTQILNSMCTQSLELDLSYPPKPPNLCPSDRPESQSAWRAVSRVSQTAERVRARGTLVEKIGPRWVSRVAVCVHVSMHIYERVGGVDTKDAEMWRQRRKPWRGAQTQRTDLFLRGANRVLTVSTGFPSVLQKEHKLHKSNTEPQVKLS